jgi:hypothetical protein
MESVTLALILSVLVAVWDRRCSVAVEKHFHPWS